MASLEDLIRSGDIRFSSCGRDIEIDMEDFGEYNRDLVDHIADKSGKFMVVSGDGLADYMKDVQGLYMMAHFVEHLWHASTSRSYPEGASVHVEVDIEAFGERYTHPDELILVDGLGKRICDAASWVSEIPFFEKSWNFALCQAKFCTGYEHPRTEEGFRYEMAQHAESFMIGTQAQLARYKKYALHHLTNATRIVGEMNADPESMFTDYFKLVSLEIEARSARNIAENISWFTAGYEPSESEEKCDGCDCDGGCSSYAVIPPEEDSD